MGNEPFTFVLLMDALLTGQFHGRYQDFWSKSNLKFEPCVHKFLNCQLKEIFNSDSKIKG